LGDGKAKSAKRPELGTNHSAREQPLAALKAAADNLQTPDGRSFDAQITKTFTDDYGSAVSDCLKTSGEPYLMLKPGEPSLLLRFREPSVPSVNRGPRAEVAPDESALNSPV
jgi:hypothetical protein